MLEFREIGLIERISIRRRTGVHKQRVSIRTIVVKLLY